MPPSAGQHPAGRAAAGSARRAASPAPAAIETQRSASLMLRPLRAARLARVLRKLQFHVSPSLLHRLTRLTCRARRRSASTTASRWPGTIRRSVSHDVLARQPRSRRRPVEPSRAALKSWRPIAARTVITTPAVASRPPENPPRRAPSIASTDPTRPPSSAPGRRSRAWRRSWACPRRSSRCASASDSSFRRSSRSFIRTRRLARRGDTNQPHSNCVMGRVAQHVLCDGTDEVQLAVVLFGLPRLGHGRGAGP